MNESQQVAQIQALADQNWMQAERFLPELEALTETGFPLSERDCAIIRKACAMVAAECRMRRHERTTR